MCHVKGGRVRFLARSLEEDEERVHEIDGPDDPEGDAWHALARDLLASPWRGAGDLTFEGAANRSASCFTVHDLLWYRGRSLHGGDCASC